MASVKLKKGRDRSINRKHPWIFSGAIESTKDILENGETVEIISYDGKLLGYGSYSKHSQISVRVLTFNSDEKIDKQFMIRRITNSINYRNKNIVQTSTNAYRLINSESDFLPGIIVDKYADILVCQFLSAGAEYWKKEIVEILANNFQSKWYL